MFRGAPALSSAYLVFCLVPAQTSYLNSGMIPMSFPALLSDIPGMKLTEIKPTAVMHACCWSSQVQDFLVHWNPIRSTKRRREGTRTDNECVTRCELSFSWVFSLSSLRIRGREGALDWRMACGTQPCPFTALKCSVFRHSLSISLFFSKSTQLIFTIWAPQNVALRAWMW